MSASLPLIKVLNVVWRLNNDGVESSIVDVLPHLPRDEIQMDFLVTSQFAGDLDERVTAMGGRILLGKNSLSPRRNHWELDRLNHRFGPFDVIHNHRHLGSSMLLRAAHKVGIPKRIAHSYADTQALQASAGLLRRIGYSAAQGVMRRHMTHGIATSAQTASSMFGAHWAAFDKVRLQALGCDFSPLRGRPARAAVRESLHLASDTPLLVAFTGFEAIDNPMALVDIAVAVIARKPGLRLMMVGEGPLSSAVLEYINRCGLRDTVFWEPVVDDPVRLIQAADGYVSTSLVEDFGLPILRAQACGIPCFLTTPCPPETTAVKELIHTLPLEGSASDHAEIILRNKAGGISPADSYSRCLESNNSIEKYAQFLRTLYL